MFRDCDKTHYYRFNDFNGPTPEQEAIAELQEDVERIDDEISKLYSHKHSLSAVNHFYCSKYGSDDNDGLTASTPWRTLHNIFDFDKDLISKERTMIRVDFLTDGDFEVYSEDQNWPWYTGVFLRFYGPSRDTVPNDWNTLPNIIFNCNAISFTNSYLGTDFVKITVADGRYNTSLGEAYHRMHLNNSSVIAKCTYFNESCHAPHCGNGSYKDCVMNKFACTDVNATFDHTMSNNEYALKLLEDADSPRSAIACDTSVVRFNGKVSVRQPSVNLAGCSVVVDKTCYIAIGDSVEYTGTGTGKYQWGITNGNGFLSIRETEQRPRYSNLRAMGYSGVNNEAGVAVYAHNSIHLGV